MVNQEFIQVQSIPCRIKCFDIYLAGGISLNIEWCMRHFFTAVFDIDFVLATVVGYIGRFKSSVTIIDHFNFARISVRAL